MLARIAHELFWLGRNLARAEHTARMLDGVFQASLQGRPDDPAGVTLDWSSLLAIMAASPGDGLPRRDEVLRALTLDPENPASVVSCVSRAREGARTVRDVISAEMWEAVNTTNLELREVDLSGRLRTGPSSVYVYVKERCALFWGLTSRTMLRDEASAFLAAGGRIESGDMVLRMLRVSLPRDFEKHASTIEQGQALALVGRTVDLHALAPLLSREIAASDLVLTGANMPAALVEIAYLTNPDQAAKAKGDDFRNAVADAMYDAIVRFRSYVEQQAAR